MFPKREQIFALTRSSYRSSRRFRLEALILLVGLLTIASVGCRSSKVNFATSDDGLVSPPHLPSEYPQIADPMVESTDELRTGPPVTVKRDNWKDLEKLPMTLDEAIEMALANSKVLQKLGGRVVSGPAGTSTIYDPALASTNALGSTEAALAAFDAQVSASMFMNHTEQKFNNIFAASLGSAKTDTGSFNFELSKTTAAGTRFSARNISNYSRLGTFDPAFNRFRSNWTTQNVLEVRQPLLRGFGTAVNRIAGPNAVAGNYNGVLIARIREDVSLVDFETAIRELINDTETAYWELYFAFRDLDARVKTRDAVRDTWEKQQKLLDGGIGRADEEAQPRQQFFSFQQQVEDAISGRLQGSLGVLGAERNLRRILGLPNNDGKLIRPTTTPAIAEVILDWDASQESAMQERLEIRRQKWIVKQRELELVAAKQLNQWRLDLVANQAWAGFGDNLFGSSGTSEGSAFDDMIGGDLDNWQLGFELSGALGRRTGYLAIRNAELQLSREKALLKEQQRQILHDLNAAYTEVDRAFNAIQNSYNNFQAVKQERDIKKDRAGKIDRIFFYLDALQRTATAESNLNRAIVDYNLALLNYARVSGTLLRQYNISLAEGPWSEVAEQEMQENAMQLMRSRIRRGRDLPAFAR